GGMLLSSQAIIDVAEIITPADYYRPAHATIHAAILDMHERGQPVDVITATAELTRRGEIARVGGASYLHTLVQATPTAANAGYYAEIVAERAKQRRTIETGTRLASMGRTAIEDADELAAAAEAELAAVRTAQHWPDPIPLGEHNTLPSFPVAALPKW
ncbi:DnaB-like helicase N-terminal domain-containing protein, partial [Escherichia coli]|uniref:DnaB-like helicase N-terminal domain-containing protein n=1 Tax=Escherichia coli TaxID=562 RepID=UPI003BA2749E